MLRSYSAQIFRVITVEGYCFPLKGLFHLQLQTASRDICHTTVTAS